MAVSFNNMDDNLVCISFTFWTFFKKAAQKKQMFRINGFEILKIYILVTLALNWVSIAIN